MNVFTTNHPLVSQPSCFDAKEHPRLAYFSRALVVAVVLCPLFVGINWIAMLGADSPDVPDPSWLDPIFEVVGLVMAFPAVLFVHADDLPASTERILVLVCLVLDGLFWAFVCVAAYRLLGSRFRKGQLAERGQNC